MAEKSEMCHCVNGPRVAMGPLQRHTPVRLGMADLGNLEATWHEAQLVRNFNGRIAGFARFTHALTDEEIAAMQ